MKNAIILHGISSKPTDFWFPYVGEQLRSRGYNVWTPNLPQPDAPDIDVVVPFLLQNGTFTSETVVIGHSSGASLILALLEKLSSSVDCALLVAGFVERGGTRPKEAVKPTVDSYAWDKIRGNAHRIFIINSVNDPWGCDETQGRIMFDRLGGTMITNHDGHMGSQYYSQPYREFPLLLSLVDTVA
ncbi:MAG TPA: alpha/beta hydrolase [Candidatus Woesebacteria bacterium]|nr:alpha/beta hydrolase [Candidatus Woesebacteria bacterium]HNS94487.1 alpha/beta hydrolase [Candidatus Woesebacteria bacterium]